MTNETRICQNCKDQFTIEPDDRSFCERIQVPLPTWCHQCRMVRRMVLRNERTLYKRRCMAPGHQEEMISIYSPDKTNNVYDEKYWWSDAWDPLDFGRPFDPAQPFFAQYGELLKRVPVIALSVTNMVDCSFCNQSEGDKGSYCITASKDDENVMYANRVVATKDSMDLYMCSKNELCYELINCHGNYRLLFSRDCEQCTESAFLYDCVGCNNCFGSSGLRNKSYYFFNQPLSKEEYLQKIKEFDLGSFSALDKASAEFRRSLKDRIRKFAHLYKCADVTGDNDNNAKNAAYCFDMIWSPGAEDCRYVNWGGDGAKDCQDCGPGFGAKMELGYEILDAGIGSSRLFFDYVVYGSHDVYYSINCHGCSYVFGCYGLRSKQYCILNKQYSKEEYEALFPRVKAQMSEMPYRDRVGQVYGYGEFFPPEIMPFAYNETIAQEYFPLTKAEAEARGYSWKDPETRQYAATLRSEDLPDHIRDASDSLPQETIACAHSGDCKHQCSTAFRIIPPELRFYRKLNLPLPRLCPNCRHYERLVQRNPMRLWARRCQCSGTGSANGSYRNTSSHSHGANPCPSEFQTSYAPDRPEIVYCESCYNNEVA